MSESKIITDLSTRDILLATKRPKKTSSYSPVLYKDVINMTLEALDKANIRVISEKYISARDGKQGNGIYHLEGGDAEMNLRLQWQNSYDKSLPLATGFGSHVVVCSNGLVLGDLFRFKRKHTGSVLKEFKEGISIYVNKAGELFKQMKDDRERMKEITMSLRTSAELVGRLFLENEIITATQLGIIKKELVVPSYNYGIKDTLWNTYNAVTVSLKDAHPQYNMNQHVKLHDFVTKEYIKEREYA